MNKILKTAEGLQLISDSYQNAPTAMISYWATATIKYTIFSYKDIYYQLNIHFVEFSITITSLLFVQILLSFELKVL